MEPKSIYLVQRATIEPLSKTPVGARLSRAVDFDYMGSAEFEFGALPKSFRAMESMIDKAQLTLIRSIRDENTAALRLFHFFDEDQLKKYTDQLVLLYNAELRTKENSRFGKNKFSKNDRTNFWWDIENHTMFSFHKAFMNRLGDHVVASLKYMNEQRRIKEITHA